MRARDRVTSILAQTVGERRYDDESQQLFDTGSAPHQIVQLFIAERVVDAGVRKRHGLPGLGVIGTELPGRWR